MARPAARECKVSKKITIYMYLHTTLNSSQCYIVTTLRVVAESEPRSMRERVTKIGHCDLTRDRDGLPSLEEIDSSLLPVVWREPKRKDVKFTIEDVRVVVGACI